MHKQRYEYTAIMNSHMPVGVSPIVILIAGMVYSST